MNISRIIFRMSAFQTVTKQGSQSQALQPTGHRAMGTLRMFTQRIRLHFCDPRYMVSVYSLLFMVLGTCAPLSDIPERNIGCHAAHRGR